MSEPPDLEPLEPPVLAAPPAIRRNWFIRNWRGELPLGQSFWVWMIGLNSALLALIGALNGISLATSERILAYPRVLVYLVMPAMAIWQRVGLWRSASRVRRTAPQLATPGLAKIWVVLSALVFIANYVRTVIPTIADEIEIMRGDPHMQPFDVVMLSPERLLIRGNLTSDAHLAFQRALDAAPHLQEVMIQSSGGRVHEGQLMAEALQRKGDLTTSVDGHCESAATYVYLGGRYREAQGRIGFHSAHMMVPNPSLEPL